MLPWKRSEIPVDKTVFKPSKTKHVLEQGYFSCLEQAYVDWQIKSEIKDIIIFQ